MSQSNYQSYPWYSEVKDIKDHLAEIDRAIEAIEKHKAQIRSLIGKIFGANSPSTQSSLPPPSNSNEDIGNEESDCSNREQACFRPNPANGKQLCPHPGCHKGPLDEKQLRRHYATHVYCSDVSIEDVLCACCKEPLDKVSTFKKNHANCLEQMKDDLPQDTIGKAVKQRDRIIEAPNKLLDAALQMAHKEGPLKNPRKRGRDQGDEESSPKIRRTEDVDASSALHVPQVNSGNETGPSASFGSSDHPAASVVPGFSFPPSEPDLGTRDSNQAGTFPASIAPDLGPDLYSIPQGTTDRYDEQLYHRSSAMVVNPMDGLFWVVPEGP